MVGRILEMIMIVEVCRGSPPPRCDWTADTSLPSLHASRQPRQRFHSPSAPPHRRTRPSTAPRQRTMLVAFTMLRGPGPLLLCRAGARALSSVPGSSGAGDDMKERAKQAVADAAGTDASHPSLMEKAREAMGKVTEKVGEMFEDTGAVGSQFTEKGAVGGTVQEKAGGESSPLDKEGSVGKQFTTEGAVGGNVQRAAERVDEAGERMQHKAQHQQGQEAAKEHTPGMRRDKV